jgi:hypothetical protein
MGDLTIKTDHKWKNFSYRYDVPKKVLREQFSHLNEEDNSDGFLCYRGHWYHLSDFMRANGHPDSAFNKYDGYASDSYFSGVLIKISKDCEQYQIATYMS